MEDIIKKLKSLPKEDKQKIIKWASDATEEEIRTLGDSISSGNLDLTPILGVKNEMPSGIGISRALIKNFGRAPESGVEYLQKTHPDFDFKIDDKGQILAKKKGEFVFGRLDPKADSLKSFVKDLPRDVIDVGYDIASGIGETAAMTAAGIGGTATTGVGGLPAAIGASGATAAGSEALRQGIGKYLGVNDRISPLEVGATGVIGSMSPAIVKGVQKVFAPALRFISKTGKEAFETYLEKNKFMKEMFKKKLPEVGQEIADKVTETARATKNQLGQDIVDSLRKSGKKINMEDVYSIIDDGIAKLEKQKAKGVAGEIIEDQIDDLRAMKKAILGGNINADPEDAFKVQQYFKDYSEFAQNPKANFSSMSPTKDMAQKENASIARSAYDKLNELFDTATDGESTQVKDAFRKYLQISKDPSKIFQDPKKTVKALGNQFDENHAYLKDSLEMLDEATKGMGLKEAGNEVAAYSVFKKPKLWQNPLSGGIFGTLTSSIPAGVGGLAGYGIGSLASEDLGPMGKVAPYVGMGIGVGLGNMSVSPFMTKKYIDLIIKSKAIPQWLKTYAPAAAMTEFTSPYDRKVTEEK